MKNFTLADTHTKIYRKLWKKNRKRLTEEIHSECKTLAGTQIYIKTSLKEKNIKTLTENIYLKCKTLHQYEIHKQITTA